MTGLAGGPPDRVPGGFWGIVGYPDPCATPELSYDQPVAFRDSPYGITRSFSLNEFAPYVIDPVMLAIESRLDLAVSVPANLGDFVVLDDSTMVWSYDPAGSDLSALMVVTRSGLTLSVNSGQHSDAFVQSRLIRIDSTHFARAHGATGPIAQVQIYSVSGSTISLDSATTLPAGITTIDSRSMLADTTSLYHSDGSVFVGNMQEAPAIGGSQRLVILPFTTGGGVNLTTTTVYNYPTIDSRTVDSAVNGSTEIAFNRGGVGFAREAFYWDGSAHFATSGVYGEAFIGGPIGGGGDGDETHPYVMPGILGTGYYAEVTQSGSSLAYSIITPIFRCGTGNTTARHTRHGTGNLAALTDFDGSNYSIRAFRW